MSHRASSAVPTAGLGSAAWLVLGLALAAIGLTLVAAEATGREFVDFSRDPNAAADVPYYFGALSTVTVLVWWTGAAVGGLAAAVMRRAGERDAALGFGLGAGLTALLAIDDGFQLHEAVYLYVVDERLVVVGYAVALALYLAVCRRWLARGPWGTLALGGALLALSAASDVVQGIADSDLHVVEDGTKLLGVTAWTTFFVGAAFRQLAPERQSETSLLTNSTRSSPGPS